MVKDAADKLSPADKQAIETAIEAARKANGGQDASAVQKALDQLTAAQHKAAESLYRQGGAGASGGPSAGESGGDGQAGATPKSDVIDAEVVDDKN
jgi:molecular chaperone DnaK